MQYNFDEIIDRSASDCSKLGSLNKLFGRDDLIPLWVADMDFRSPPAVVEALKRRVEHSVFGYTMEPKAFKDSIIRWLERYHNWRVEREHITYLPGVVKGIIFAIELFTYKGDNIIIQPPVYHPFRISISNMEREVVNNPLILENQQYRMDFDGLRKIVSEKRCKMLILCNPHNPGGRVWKAHELSELAEICWENNILLLSDEIHSDMTMPGYSHTPFAKVSDKARDNSITLMAPSKTFNIAGIVSSFAVIPNSEIREKYFNWLALHGLGHCSLFAYTATIAAYSEGADWLDQMLKYVYENICFVDNYLKENIPEIKAFLPEASFLVWLDCRSLNLSQEELVKLFVDKARLALNDGAMFGPGGEGFMRLNVGTPRLVLEKALNNLTKALNS